MIAADPEDGLRDRPLPACSVHGHHNQRGAVDLLHFERGVVFGNRCFQLTVQQEHIGLLLSVSPNVLKSGRAWGRGGSLEPHQRPAFRESRPYRGGEVRLTCTRCLCLQNS